MPYNAGTRIITKNLKTMEFDKFITTFEQNLRYEKFQIITINKPLIRNSLLPKILVYTIKIDKTNIIKLSIVMDKNGITITCPLPSNSLIFSKIKNFIDQLE